MRMKIGLTGPSSFTAECVDLVEEYYGANPIILYQNKQENLIATLKDCQAVILAGGADIHPSIHGNCCFIHHNLSKFDIERDYRELTVITYCLEHNIPILGICRGHQMLGVYYGMTLHMDISDGLVAHAPKSHGINIQASEPAHWISLTPNSGCNIPEEELGPRIALRQNIKKAAEYDVNKIWVNSFHHQGLKYDKEEKKELAAKAHFNEIKVLGTAKTLLNTCEVIVELMSGNRWISCQWHPEYDWRVNPASKMVLRKFKELL